MQHFVAFLLILVSSLSSSLFACGPYYPYGEGIRFNLFKPHVYSTVGLNAFQYSSHAFQLDDESVALGASMNVELWKKRAGTTLSNEVIYDAIYHSEREIKQKKFTNAFLISLMKKGDKTALDYLRFANKCTSVNNQYQDPWERKEKSSIPARTKLLNEALVLAAKSTDKDIAIRYAFLAIRLAYYNGNYTAIEKTYATYFANRTEKNILDYWSLYFKAITESNPVHRNFYAAQVFMHAPDKRFAIYDNYNTDVAIEQTLDFAKTNEEKAAIWLMNGLHTPGKNSESIQAIQQLTPASEALSILLLREVNKLEDWIFTPYYTEFSPSTDPYYTVQANDMQLPVNERISRDRLYAAQLLKWLDQVDYSQTQNPVLWQSAAIYLNFMTQDNKKALSLISKLEQSANVTQEIRDQIDQIKALCLIAQQAVNKTVIPESIEAILIRESGKGNNRFIFAVARELEYKGNTTDGALLLSNINTSYSWDEEQQNMFWKAKDGFRTLYSDYYYDYFFYIDGAYSIPQVADLIVAIEKNQASGKFNTWKYASAKKDLSRLYDLLGTKFMRKNELVSALSAFSQVKDSLWQSDNYSYKTYLNANPFYTNMYNEHSATKADTIRYTKKTLVKQLLAYHRKVESAETTNKDYYFFLIANCELNMSYYGNSWMMKRYYSSASETKGGLEDDDDYYHCDRAKMYYLKAKSASKSKKFQALCLRMAGRCEKYKLMWNLELNTDWNSYEEYDHKLFEANKYWKEIKKDYPDDYDELISNCESFDRYFQSHN